LAGTEVQVTRRAVLRVLFVLALAGSASHRGNAFPGSRHLFYLHGRIVQDEQSARPVSPRFGAYELEAIRAAFRERGFVLHSEIRPKGASVSESADRVVADVRKLLDAGVPAERITVVGASMGASIALLAAARLGDPDVRFVALGACRSGNVEMLIAEEGKAPSGRILFVREASDDTSGPCPPWKGHPELAATLVTEEVVLETGRSHGFLYRPLPEWLEPTVAWATGAEAPLR
jgi:pimeloyl-ACP methyl ester carboxylesterase